MRLKEFYDWKQVPEEAICSYTYDLQKKLTKIQYKELNKVPDADGMLKGQLVLSLKTLLAL